MQSSMVKLVTLAPGGARLLSTSSRLDRWVLDCQQNGCTLWKLPTPSSTGSSLTSLWWLEGEPAVVGRPTSLQTSSARTRCLVEILSILRNGKFMSNINKCQVAVIEPGEMHYYQPMWTLVINLAAFSSNSYSYVNFNFSRLEEASKVWLNRVVL